MYPNNRLRWADVRDEDEGDRESDSEKEKEREREQKKGREEETDRHLLPHAGDGRVLRLRGVQEALPGNTVRPDAEDTRPCLMIQHHPSRNNSKRPPDPLRETQRGRNHQNR